MKTKYIYDMTDDDIEELIKKYLPIKKKEKDTNGEVFTPSGLINKMFDKFPKEVWFNPNYKWLDPSGGIGNFLIILYQRLMKGLTTWEPNINKRSDHIICNMLFIVEINSINCKICKSIFGANLHIICGDFLQDLPLFKDIYFDCIVGNPPFQDNFGQSTKGKRILGGKSKLYERIFIKSYQLLKTGGYISFIVPDNIFSGNGSASYKIIIKHHVRFASFNSVNNVFFPNIQQKICFFLLCKTSIVPSNITIIENHNGEQFDIILEDRPVNPIRNWSLYTEKLIKKYVSSNRNNVVYNRGQNLTSYTGNKFPIIYSPTKNISTNNEKLVIGLGIKKAVIFAISPDLLFKMDYSGKFGVGPNTFYIPFSTIIEGKIIEHFLNSNDYKTLANATKTTRQYLKISFIEHIKLPKYLKIITKKHKKKHHCQKNITKKILQKNIR